MSSIRSLSGQRRGLIHHLILNNTQAKPTPASSNDRTSHRQLLMSFNNPLYDPHISLPHPASHLMRANTPINTSPIPHTPNIDDDSTDSVDAEETQELANDILDETRDLLAMSLRNPEQRKDALHTILENGDEYANSPKVRALIQEQHPELTVLLDAKAILNFVTDIFPAYQEQFPEVAHDLPQLMAKISESRPNHAAYLAERCLKPIMNEHGTVHLVLD